MSTFGPYETEAMAQYDIDLTRASSRSPAALTGWLIEACHGAHLGVGEFDFDVLVLCGMQRPTVVQALVGLIGRAYEAGVAHGPAGDRDD